jgi:hypothetical protein
MVNTEYWRRRDHTTTYKGFKKEMQVEAIGARIPQQHQS